MNELISQEKKYKIINQVLEFLDSDKPINDISEYLEDEIRNINKNHKDIGLKDINGKNIYADSSIVEYGIQKWKVIYNVFQMSYELECVLNKSLSNMRLTGAYQNQLKIIDTIQENKLGLIK